MDLQRTLYASTTGLTFLVSSLTLGESRLDVHYTPPPMAPGALHPVATPLNKVTEGMRKDESRYTIITTKYSALYNQVANLMAIELQM